MMDTAIAQVRDEVLPAIQGMKGCLGLSMLVNRETGRGIVTTAWETIEDLTTSREMVHEMRDRVTQTLGADKADVEEWEVAAMHRNHHTGEGACARVTWVKGDPADLIETVAKALADQPDAVSVRESERRGGTVFELQVASGDLGRVIGRQKVVDRRRQQPTLIHVPGSIGLAHGKQ